MTASIRRATPADTAVVTDTLAAAFLHGDLAPWLVPDPTERRQIYPRYFAIFAEYFITHEIVELTGDGAAVALWSHTSDRFDPDIPAYDQRLADACGHHLDRFINLDAAMYHHHPTGVRHAYLAFLAVRLGLQRQGVGTALLRHHHTQLDAISLPAYLEATGPGTAALYGRHGYISSRRYYLSRGVALRPMWREPRDLRSSQDKPSPGPSDFPAIDVLVCEGACRGNTSDRRTSNDLTNTLRRA